ncbi:hypothetical protein [Amycolatopsis sp. w19]|uniref:hypothetical protein n=1 Tax=Amycolatopsis sp. w19 TaxID=3448134 RepID=UPI003F1E173E
MSVVNLPSSPNGPGGDVTEHRGEPNVRPGRRKFPHTGWMNPGETLLSTSRTFQLWRYGVGHSELFLRSGFRPQSEPVELYFEGVRSMHFDDLDFPELTVWRDEDVTVENDTARFHRLRIELRSPKHTGVVVASRLTYIDGTYPDGQMKWTVTAPGGEEIGGGPRPTCE